VRSKRRLFDAVKKRRFDAGIDHQARMTKNANAAHHASHDPEGIGLRDAGDGN